MALRIWLPLNGTLENKGISAVTATTFETPTYIAGKIGQCYQRANSNSQLTNGINLNSNLMNILGTQASIAVWVKPLGTHTHYNGTIASSGNWNAKKWAFGVSQDNSQVDVLCGGYNNYITCAVPVNQWTHLVSTFDNGTCKLYKNGEYVGQLTGQKAFETDAANACIARETYASGYFGFNGCVNDVRIYDHCLSVAEVHEISQGLILHYKLNGFQGSFGNPNLVAGSNTTSTSTNSWGASSAVGGNTSTIVQDENGHTCVQITRDATAQSSWDYLYYSNLLRNLIKTNTTYTVSFDCKPSVDGSIGFAGFINGNATNYMTASTSTIQGTCYANQWNHMVYRCTTKASFSDISVGGQVVYFSRSGSLRGINTTVLFKNIKVEEGTVDTPWCPANSELTIDRTHIQDSSGYGHNGTITGTPTLNSNTPRYSSCIQLTSGQKISSDFPIKGSNPIWSINFWLKTYTVTYTQWSDVVTIPGTWQFRMETVNTNGTYVNWFQYPKGTSSGIGNAASQREEWHMHTLVWSNSTVASYRDGVLVNSIAISGDAWTPSGTFSIGDSGMYMYMSDFRIYATALSVDDMKQLYNTAAKVDNLGNWHTFEFKETNGIAKVKKTGITEANEVYDNMNFNNRAQIVKNNSKVLIASNLDIVTTYSSTKKTGTIASLPGATVKSLAGKTLRFIYDVCAPGVRYSTEQGQTAWNYTRYGIHGSCSLDGSVNYPFAGQLNYSGNSFHAIQTWTIPTGKSTYGDLGFSIQNFDKPSSTNNATWFIRNVRLELVDGTSENITGTQLIER